MGRIRPVFDVQRMYLMSAHHLLQANNIRANAAHGVAQFGKIKRRLNAVKPLWVLIVSTFNENPAVGSAIILQ